MNCKNCGLAISFYETNERKSDGSFKWIVLNAETKTRHLCQFQPKQSKFCECKNSNYQFVCMACGLKKRFCPICRADLNIVRSHEHRV